MADLNADAPGMAQRGTAEITFNPNDGVAVARMIDLSTMRRSIRLATFEPHAGWYQLDMKVACNALYDCR
jgi:hypothetical protein